MTAVRIAATLDLVERLRAAAGVRVVVLSDDPPLLASSRALGCGARQTVSHGFDWLQAIQEAVRAEADPEEAVLVLGGCAAPLLGKDDVERLFALAAEGHFPANVEGDGGAQVLLAANGRGWQNNRLSPDLVLWQPARAALAVKACVSDNDFGYALATQAGVAMQVLPRELAWTFDVDTPLDALLASASPACGPRLRMAVQQLPGQVPLRGLQRVLAQPYPDVALIGRVHPVEAERFAEATGIRLRLYAEERGMKALGRMEQGLVRSLVADLVAQVGWAEFFQLLARSCQAALFDTRVVWAALGRTFSEQDRFAADLLLPDAVHDPWLREMTQAACAAPIPILLGGQSLVAGGLRLVTKGDTRPSTSA